MNTAASLRAHTSKKLAEIAKKKGIPGWHSMRKEQLVRALLKLTKKKSTIKTSVPTNTRAVSKPSKIAKPKNGNRIGRRSIDGSPSQSKTTAKKKTARKTRPQDPRISKIIRDENHRREQLKDLALTMARNGKTEPNKDRVVLIVRDPYWMQAYWEITRATVQRASVALAEQWHTCQPIIRVFEITDDNATHAVEQAVRDIHVHGGVKNWFIDVPDPPKCYRIGIGYLTSDKKFYLIAKSNEVTTPIPSSSDTVDFNWTDIAQNYQKFYALSGGYGHQIDNDDLREVFEDKLRRPMTTPMFAQIASNTHGGLRGFDFAVDAEMIIYGTADPEASVTLAGEPVKLRSDGTFEVRMSMPDRRQVLPIVACSRDGTEQRTTVVAIERNTKVMEPISREVEDV